MRVGSIVWTPLHSMVSKESPYTVPLLGKTNWKGKSLVAVEVAFQEPVRNGVGLGGQTGTTYSSCSYSTATARIMIEPAKAIPLFIDSWSPLLPQVNRRYHCVWAFGPDFLDVGGGFAPAMFQWEDADDFRERQEFQVVGGVCDLKQGDAWFGAENPFGRSGHIQKLELRDLRITANRADGKPSAAKDIAVDLALGVKMVLVLISAGSFTMGDDKGQVFEQPALRSPSPSRSTWASTR